jgi:hypothetical protein
MFIRSNYHLDFGSWLLISDRFGKTLCGCSWPVINPIINTKNRLTDSATRTVNEKTARVVLPLSFVRKKRLPVNDNRIAIIRRKIRDLNITGAYMVVGFPGKFYSSSCRL